jgi:hypothetical protein
MTGLVDWNNEEDPGREDRDRAAFGKEYGLVRYPDGQEYACNGRIVRFLVEVCGHSYNEAVEALVEHIQSQPHGYRVAPDVEADAKAIRAGAHNIIEALFSLKVDRLVHEGDATATDYSWRVTRVLMQANGEPKFP